MATQKQAKVQSQSDFMAQYKKIKKIEDDFVKSNDFQLYGVIESKYVTEPRVKMDKDGNTRLDRDGNPLTYPQKCYVELAFFGGSAKFELAEKFIPQIETGDKVVLKGHFGTVNNFGSQEFGYIVDHIVTLESMLDGVEI